MPKYSLFANTGMQYIYTGLMANEAGLCWRHVSDEILWIQYRTAKGAATGAEVVLCVDTNTGKHAHVAVSEARLADSITCIHLDNLGIESPIEIEILPRGNGTGEAKRVAFVLDFGNSRSVGLLVEGDKNQISYMLPARPFELFSHHMRWSSPSAKEKSDQHVFESGFVFVSDRLPPVDVQAVDVIPPKYAKETRSFIDKILGRDAKETLVSGEQQVLKKIRTDLFQDISPVRLGAERVFHLNQEVYKSFGRPLVGLSGPKRYLWDQDLVHSGRYWHQFNPDNETVEAVGGDYFKHVFEDDRDWDEVPQNQDGTYLNPCPRYPRRSMIVACIYELLDRAYQQINSVDYRAKTPEPMRKRVLSNLVMSYPSGLSHDEFTRYQTQVNKAVDIFCHVHNLAEDDRPVLRMAIDEGAAGQVAYVYGEIQAFNSAESWLELVGRPIDDNLHRVRIASIDIGGGTSDLVISDFIDHAPGQATDLSCTIRHVDGANRAGDDLMEAVLQRIIIPQLANQVGLSRDETKKLFEDMTDQKLADQRSDFLRNIWKPLANQYIAMANGDDGSELQLGQMGLIDTESTLNELEKVLAGHKSSRVIVGSIKDKTIVYRKKEFQKVLMELLRPILAGFCDTITSHDCDIVTLAGRPSNLLDLQELVYAMLPLPSKRIVPMGNYRTGPWYPLQDPDRPGVIKDPKSVVVVGCAIEHLSSESSTLGSVRVKVLKNIDNLPTYYWGEVSRNKRYFRNSDALFKAGDGFNQSEVDVTMVGGEFIIARRLSSKNESEPMPAFALRCRDCMPQGPLRVTICCQRYADGTDETIVLVAVSGEVKKDGEIIPAEIDTHVDLTPRGMIEMEHFLDDGVFFNIDYEKISE